MQIYFVSHPEVKIDPKKNITKWGLSNVGIKRTKKFARQNFVIKADQIFSSYETKAFETAKILSGKNIERIKKLRDLGEIDRSSTGYLPLEKFEFAVHEFYEKSNKSYKGWETAIDAQKRIVKVITDKILLKIKKNKNVIIVSHGGVGTLLMCSLLGKDILEKMDQPSQGCYFTFTSDLKVIHVWKKI